MKVDTTQMTKAKVLLSHLSLENEKKKILQIYPFSIKKNNKGQY